MCIISHETRSLLLGGNWRINPQRASPCCCESLSEDNSSNLGSNSFVKILSGSSLIKIFSNRNYKLGIDVTTILLLPQILFQKTGDNRRVHVYKFNILPIIVSPSQFNDSCFKSRTSINSFHLQSLKRRISLDSQRLFYIVCYCNTIIFDVIDTVSYNQRQIYSIVTATPLNGQIKRSPKNGQIIYIKRRN